MADRESVSEASRSMCAGDVSGPGATIAESTSWKATSELTGAPSGSVTDGAGSGVTSTGGATSTGLSSSCSNATASAVPSTATSGSIGKSGCSTTVVSKVSVYSILVIGSVTAAANCTGIIASSDP